MHFTVQSTTYVYQRIDELSVTTSLHVSAVHLFLNFFTSAFLNYQ